MNPKSPHPQLDFRGFPPSADTALQPRSTLADTPYGRGSFVDSSPALTTVENQDMRHLLASMTASAPVRFTILIAALLLAFPAHGAAQTGLSVGPRFSFINSNVVNISSTNVRYFGGVMRFRSSPKTGFELSADYRSMSNELGTERTRDIPLQASLLMYLGQQSFQPYVLGGIGWYKTKIEQYADDTLLSETSLSKVGYHAGLGTEVKVHSRASIHIDYRYTFIRFGDESGNSAPGAVPMPFTQGLQERLKLSHEGSMWTTGVTFNF